MSEDSAKTAPAANQEVDLDNIEVEILIICKDANKLNSAGSFLTRRGWPTTVLADLTKGIEHLADKKPDYVLISFSHPSPQITKLPDLITQTFNLSCIGFVETADAQSNARLNNSKVRYKINGQVSGPSVHRTIRKLLADRFNVKTEEKSSSGERSQKDTGGGVVKIKGTNAANGPGVIMQKSSANATKDKGAQMIRGQGGVGDSENPDQENSAQMGFSEQIDGLSDGDSGYVPMENDEAEGSPGAAPSSGRQGRMSLKDLAGDSVTAPVDASGNMLFGQNLAANLKKSMFGEDGVEKQNSADSSETESKEGFGNVSVSEADLAAAFASSENNNEKDKDSGKENGKGKPGYSGGMSLEQATRTTEEAREAEEKEAAALAAIAAQASISAKQKEAVEEAEAKAREATENAKLQAQVAATAAAKAEKEAAEKAEAEAIAKDPVRAAQSLMQKAVEAAMARYCKNPPDSMPTKLEEITYVGVFPIESEALPGYLTLVWQAPDLGSREAFLRDCEVEIRAAFGSMNVAGKLNNGFWTQLPAVDFVAWADHKANFHFMTAHQKREVGVAFFKSAAPLPQAAPAEGGMYSLKVTDMSTEVAVNFKAYIYLKNNQKHFMYLRNGRKLQPEQKDRLIKSAVTEVFMKSVDLENLRHYLAAGYLSALIIEFNAATATDLQSIRKSS